MEILIIDDHPVFRAGLRQILLDLSQDLIISEVGSGRDALKCLDVREPDAMVLDISLSDLNGIEVLREIRRTRSSLPVIILTMHDEVQYRESAARTGATGFLSKMMEPEPLARAILEAAASGGREGGGGARNGPA